MGRYIDKYLKSQGFDGNVYLNYPKNIGKTNVSEVELTPSRDSNLLWAITKYKKEIKVAIKAESLNDLNKASVDFGMVNVMTVFSPNIPFPIIYKGGKILYINKHYKHVIGKNQSRLKIINDVYDSKLTRQLWEERERDRKIMNEFNKISTHFINECLKYGITEVILGYNKNWKNKVNLGRKTNDAFYKIPYRKLINMIFYKGVANGKHPR